MSIYNLPPLLAGLVILFLGGLAIGKGPKGQVNRAWAGLALCLAIWSFGTFTLYISPDEQTAISWLVLYNIGVILIPATFLHFVLALSDDSSKLGKRVTVVVYSISGLFVVLSLLKYFNPGVSHHPWGYYPVTGPANIYFDGFFAIVLTVAVIRLIWAFRLSTGWKRNQYIYIFIAALIGFGSGVTNFLPLYGGRVYPIGHIGILLTATIITIAIIK